MPGLQKKCIAVQDLRLAALSAVWLRLTEKPFATSGGYASSRLAEA